MKKILVSFQCLLMISSCTFSETDSKADLKPKSEASSFDLISIKRKKQLMHLLLADCGSCHGMTLQGGLGPSLLAKDLHNKTDEELFNTIKNGTLGTPMPPWKQFLNDSEIHWMLNSLRQQSWKE